MPEVESQVMADAEMRIALGVAVFSGMVGVTIFGLFFTPVSHEVNRGAVDRRAAASRPAHAAAAQEKATWS